MKPKLRAFEGASTIRAVADGTVEMVGIGMGPIMNEPGAELVGPLPAELQNYVYFAGAVGTQAKAPKVAGEFLRFLKAARSAPVLRAKGLEPF
jgi:molybdate transport system substrate-binding protein